MSNRDLALLVGTWLLLARGSVRAAEEPSDADARATEGRTTADPLATDACPERWEAASGPLPGGAQPSQPTDFGAIPEACPASDLALRLRGALLDDSAGPGFFGDVLADMMVRGRRRLGARGWVSLSVDLLAYRYVNDGGLSSSGLSFGPATLGYYQRLAATRRTAVAIYARALLPLDTARQNGLETGLELGGSARMRLRPRWALDGGLSLAGPLDVVDGQAHARLEPAALAEAWFSPRPALALFAGGTLRVRLAPTPKLLTVVPRGGLRAALRRSLWLAFLAEAPVAGADRTDVIASLFLGWSP